SLLLILLDQVTKLLVYGYIKPNNSIVVNEFFSLTHVHNYGAAFSFLADQSGWQRYALSGISIIASIAIMVWMRRVAIDQVLKLSALSILLAGAVGNLIDRFFLGFVIDFIDLHYQTLYWPIFNVADILISVGVALLLFSDMKKS
ncbi:MAG: lipoprotein signal peptidase, partial [Candidatus Ruthia sp.]|nr:lipoprotein signal peptidase [Candidatus Ruthturnera sp.]MBT4669285.1 lipoprotein signal peptidase [Candidatus Ruthturnera sp.]